MKRNPLHFTFTSQLVNTEIISILVIIAVWAVMVLIINPSGNFPLNDDWVYVVSCKKSFGER